MIIVLRAGATEEDVRQIEEAIKGKGLFTLEDVRRFYQTWYVPANATLVIAGDFDPAQVTQWIDKHFGPIPKGSQPIPRDIPAEPPQTAERRTVDYHPNTPLPAIVLTYHGPKAGTPDLFALEVAANVLSAGESSRLYRRLGLAVVGKTAGPEYRLARMYRMCLGILSIVVNPAEGHGEFEHTDLQTIYRRCGPAVARMVIETLAGLPAEDGDAGGGPTCHCADVSTLSLFREFGRYVRYEGDSTHV